MKFNELIHDQYQSLGLKFVNFLARSGAYQHNESGYGENLRHRYDSYLHLNQAEARPKIIFLYGGGWQSGDRKDFRFVADTLCVLGFDVYVPDYRLYPEVRFDVILEDVVAAVDAIMNEIEGPVFIMGHSAGAQLGALLSLNADLLQSPERILGFIGLAGPYDFYPFTEDHHWDLFAPEEAYPSSQPVNYVRANAPPLLLLHGKDDTRVRRGHSKSLMEKQLAVGGRASREVYDKMGHIDIILSFTILRRRNSRVVTDLQRFVLQYQQT